MKRGILLGAGFSFDLGMPLGYELTEVFLNFLSKERCNLFARLLSANQPYPPGSPINKNSIFEGFGLVEEYRKDKGKNYEELLNHLQPLGGRIGKTQSDRDSYDYIFSFLYEVIYQILKQYQFESYEHTYPRNFEWFKGVSNLLADSATWIFTLNHDLFIECLAIDLGIPITYGGTGNISFPLSNVESNKCIEFTTHKRTDISIDNAQYFNECRGINLVKLHGGLSEFEYRDSTLFCNQTLQVSSSKELINEFKRIVNMAYYHNGSRERMGGSDRIITDSDGQLDIIKQAMLTGGAKYSVTTNKKAGEEKLDLFSDVLHQLDELHVIGYGFGDLHVNYRISNAMVMNSSLNLKIVDPVHRPEKPEFLRQFNYGERLRGGQCGAAHWLDYFGTGKWNRKQMEGLKENEKFRDIVRHNVEKKLLSWS